MIRVCSAGQSLWHIPCPEIHFAFAGRSFLVGIDLGTYNLFNACRLVRRRTSPTPMFHRARFLAASLLVLVFARGALSGASAADSFPVTIKVDAGKSLGELKPIWRFFGAD